MKEFFFTPGLVARASFSLALRDPASYTLARWDPVFWGINKKLSSTGSEHTLHTLFPILFIRFI